MYCENNNSDVIRIVMVMIIKPFNFNEYLSIIIRKYLMNYFCNIVFQNVVKIKIQIL